MSKLVEALSLDSICIVGIDVEVSNYSIELANLTGYLSQPLASSMAGYSQLILTFLVKKNGLRKGERDLIGKLIIYVLI